MNLGFSEMAFLVVLGLLLFGPKKLPEIGRQIGKVLAEFRRASNEFQAQLNDEVRQLELESHVEEVKQVIMPPLGIAARGDLPSYALDTQPVIQPEPNSGEHTGETLNLDPTLNAASSGAASNGHDPKGPNA